MFLAGSNAAEPSVNSDPPAGEPDFWKQIIDPVRPFLERVSRSLTDQIEGFDSEIASFARYALSNQGKQLRPALVVLSGNATGSVGSAHVTVAVIIEMVHLATLVHDDVVDEAEIRRCRPTVAANWGNEISVLLGDCLFANALKLAASFPTPEICRAVAAATNTVCSGEILQTLRRRNFQLSRSEYFKALEMKTAELFALSCELGGCLAGADPAERAGLRKYGLAFGTAYQVYDDCLDLFGNEASAGKSLGTDLATGKCTLPMLLLNERASDSERSLVQELVNDWEPRLLPELRALLLKHDALEGSRAIIHQLIGTGQKGLAALPPSQSQTALVGLLEFLAQQTDHLGVTSS